MARSLERACFDYILLEDSSYVGESFGGSTEIYLKKAIAVPRQDPSVVAALMTQVTSRIGIVPTFGTYAYHPYLLARLMATLDQVSAGRAGWNAVTGSSDFAAMNFGMPGMPEHDLRYDMADEYMEVVRGLWGSWEPGAMIADRKSGNLIDHTKVHAVNYEGKYFKTRGPLNSGPSPQGRPVIAQAGGSPRGRRFAAAHADTIVVNAKGIDAMRAYRDDVHKHMIAQGRKPQRLQGALPDQSDPRRDHGRGTGAQEEARGAWPRPTSRSASPTSARSPTSTSASSTSTSRCPTTSPPTAISSISSSSGPWPAGRSIRKTMASFNAVDLSIELCGTCDSVAARMGEVMQEVGGDGFLFSMPNVNRRTLAEIEDGLVPALQDRGLVRKAYEHKQFRDNLLAY